MKKISKLSCIIATKKNVHSVTRIVCGLLIAVAVASCGGNDPEAPDSNNTTVNGNGVYMNEPTVDEYGTLKGRFTVDSKGTQVRFSKGNLQYVGTWQFAENQWDYFGEAQSDNHRDLFRWGTGDAPNKVSYDYSDYAVFSEWGDNPITNGGNTVKLWRTLTVNEWDYLLRKRKNAATLFGLGCVNGINGTIILPDNCVLPIGASFIASTTKGLYWLNDRNRYRNDNKDNFSHNIYTKEQWSVMEKVGAVFLPTAGFHYSTGVFGFGSNGDYWSVTPNGKYNACYFFFSSDDLGFFYYGGRQEGRSVRLVR